MQQRDDAQRSRRVSGRLRERLTYANVMATIAVFGVLGGGGAYAASKIGPNDIKKNAVRTKHIKNGAVQRAKLARAARRPNVIVRQDTDGPGTFNLAFAECNPGEVATGGGIETAGASDVETNRPLYDANNKPIGWEGSTSSPTSTLLVVYAICASS